MIKRSSIPNNEMLVSNCFICINKCIFYNIKSKCNIMFEMNIHECNNTQTLVIVLNVSGPDWVRGQN